MMHEGIDKKLYNKKEIIESNFSQYYQVFSR